MVIIIVIIISIECKLPELSALFFFFKVLTQLIFTQFLKMDTIIISFYKWKLRPGELE